MSRLEEIKQNTAAFKHWYEVQPQNQPQPYEESVGPYLEWLIEKLEEAISIMSINPKNGKEICLKEDMISKFLEGLEK